MAQNNSSKKVTVIGAGLVGSLLSIDLARRGYDVEIFERRPDMRTESISAGRSINLALSTRGIHALRALGLEDEMLKQAIPMYGRMIHPVKGEQTFQRYGKDDSEFINSISRAGLNKALMSHAEASGRVKIHFRTPLLGIDLETNTLELRDENTGLTKKVQAETIIGTDGSASVIRREFAKNLGHRCTEDVLDYGYKELHIEPGRNGAFCIEKNALHIWPRGTFMLIALPNLDGSFTVTLFLPFKGTISFESLTSAKDVEEFFECHFADVQSLIPDLATTFFKNPTGQMVTVKTSPWHHQGRILLLGDAAHAIVPFFGQGMNCGFEDCSVLGNILSANTKNGKADWETTFSTFSGQRKVDTDAIADMAVENFIEMRDKVANPRFVLEKEVEKILQKTFPGQYRSRYSLVTFSRLPYRQAFEAGLECDKILHKLCDKIDAACDVDLDLADKLIAENLAPRLKNLV